MSRLPHDCSYQSLSVIIILRILSLLVTTYMYFLHSFFTKSYKCKTKTDCAWVEMTIKVILCSKWVWICPVCRLKASDKHYIDVETILFLCWASVENTGVNTERQQIFNFYHAEIFLYRPWRPKIFSISNQYYNVLVSSFRFIWIPMLWLYGHCISNSFSAGSTLDVRIWRLKTSDSDV